ncbi:MBL fold metallo-hydrolase [Kineococcus sp. GCM10028916]|uniref:MBL fold metallo-hydrolase n=1 Tax=Kineococcus sp. GCM10028916 TaxID=3273394 RepID=UPI003633464D
MRIRIHRGCHEVGGCCIELEARGERLVLDVSRSLTAGRDEHVPLPDVSGLATGDDPTLLGVVVSRPHLDHYGLLDQVAPSVLVFAGGAAVRMVEAAQFFSPGPRLRADRFLEDGVPLAVGSFKITPHLVDHSAFDSYAVIVEADGKRVLYTGDLRGHGRKRRLFNEMVATPPRDIDTLLVEGTHVTGKEPRNPGLCSEEDVELRLAETLRTTAGLVAVVPSAQNIDRLVTVYRAAKRAGRTFVVDLYSATTTRSTRRTTIPQPGFPKYRLYLTDRQRSLVERTSEFARTEAVREHRVFPEELLRHPDRFVVVTQASTVDEFRRRDLLFGGRVVWSLWDGYLDDRFTARPQAQGIPLVHHHTSGHATSADLHRLITAVGARQVVLVHTEAAHLVPTAAPRPTGLVQRLKEFSCP